MKTYRTPLEIASDPVVLNLPYLHLLIVQIAFVKTSRLPEIRQRASVSMQKNETIKYNKLLLRQNSQKFIRTQWYTKTVGYGIGNVISLFLFSLEFKILFTMGKSIVS